MVVSEPSTTFRENLTSRIIIIYGKIKINHKISNERFYFPIFILQELQKKVVVEQDEFTKYLEENAVHFPDNYSFINDGAKRYVQVCFKLGESKSSKLLL